MVTRTKLWTPSNRFSELAGLYRDVLEILDRIDGQLTTRTDADTGVITVESDSDGGHSITTSSKLDVYFQGGQRIGMDVTGVTNKAITVDAGTGDDLPSLNDWVWMKVQGEGATLFPLGDHIHGALTGSTLTTIGEQQVTVTASEAWNAWDVPAGRFVGIIPYLDFNNIDEEADTPDIAYFSRDDSAGQGMSVGALLFVPSDNSERPIMTKAVTDNLEWAFEIDTDSRLKFRLADESVSATVDLKFNDTQVLSSWYFGVFTYDGRGGASAFDGMTLFQDGVQPAQTTASAGTFVAMEPSSGRLNISATGVPGNAQFFNGRIAMLFYALHELTADSVAMLDDLIRGAAGLT